MRKHRELGLTIVEVQLSFLIILVVVLALLGLMPMVARLGETAGSRARALYTATQVMEERLQDNITDDAGTTPAPEVGKSGSVRWSTSGVGTNSNTRTLYVEVTWIEQNRPQRLELKSLVYR